MFSYVDPRIKAELVAKGLLFSIDEHGQRCSATGPSAQPYISLVGPIPLPVRLTKSRHKSFQWYAWVAHSDLGRIEQAVAEVRSRGPTHLQALLTNHLAVNSVLIFGDLGRTDHPLVRVHSNCLTGDVFGSMRCDCGPQLHAAITKICAEGAGIIVYMASHEGRGIGLWAKAITYLLQDGGEDTYHANERLGLPADSRDFGDAGRVLRFFLGPKPVIRLLGNNPLKRVALEAQGIQVLEQEPLVVGVSSYNARYLKSKQLHGHLIPEEALASEKPPE
jgi:GTP cyclohydrolase II